MKLSNHRHIHRLKKKNIQLERREHWLDIWLPRISNFSQFGLFVITLGSLYFVVLPLYQKAVLDEQIARKEIELKNSEIAIEKSYDKLRSYAVKQFVFKAGIRCSIQFIPFDSSGHIVKKEEKDSETILSADITKCLNNVASHTEEIKDLKSSDAKYFSSELNSIAVQMEQKRIVLLKQYKELPDKAKLNPLLVKTPRPFAGAYLEAVERFYKELKKANSTYEIPTERLKAKRFEAGVRAAQFEIENKYTEFVQSQLLTLNSLAWNKH